MSRIVLNKSKYSVVVGLFVFLVDSFSSLISQIKNNLFAEGHHLSRTPVLLPRLVHLYTSFHTPDELEFV